MVKKDKVTFRNSFKDQRSVPGLTDGAIDVDEPIDITLRPQEVIVLEGICAAGANAEADSDGKDDNADTKKSQKKKKSRKKSGKKKKKSRK